MSYEPALGSPAPSPSRGPLRTALLVVSILLIGAGVAGVNLTNAESGADSPQAAVERLVRAITDEDPLAFIAALEPAEADLFRDSYEPTADNADENGLVDRGDPLASVDLKATNMRYAVEQLGQEVASVRVTAGDLSASYDPAKLTDDARQQLADEFNTELNRPHSGSASIAELERDFEDRLPALVTVKRGGQWYVSIFYTIAELIRSESELPVPDFDRPPASQGAASPKGVIEALAAAIGGVDPDAGLQLLDPESLRVLVDYRAAILSQIPAEELAKARREFSAALDGLEVTTAELDSTHTRVDIVRLEGHGRIGPASGNLQRTTAAVLTLDQTCLTYTITDARETSEGVSCLADSGKTFGLKTFFLVVAQRDGQYYFDPLATLNEYARIMTTSDDFESLFS